MVGDHKGTVPTNDYKGPVPTNDYKGTVPTNHKGPVPTTELHVIHGDSPRPAVGFMLSDESCAW